MTQKTHVRLGLHGRLAATIGRLARRASITLGKGSGGIIGGRIANYLDPQILRKLTADKKVVIVSGTNGKTTTNKMVAKALGTMGSVATNNLGDNMESGATSALLQNEGARYAALEVDELRVPWLADMTNPVCMVLLNLSRDQLDRVGEITRLEQTFRKAVNAHPESVVVANCDDPLIASAAWEAPRVQWVAAGCSWSGDSTAFPRTGTTVLNDGNGQWSVVGHPEYSRPEPDWWIEGNDLVSHEGRWPLHLQLPGHINYANAAQAIVAAVAAGIPIDKATRAVETVTEVAGRYAEVDIDGRQTQLLLAKNPAGWQQAFTMIPRDATCVVLGVNGQIADGTDLSWIWDVDFEYLSKLKDCRILACGERGADLAVRLKYAGFEPELFNSPWDAVQAAPAGPVHLLANYTSFRDFKALLAERGLWKVNP